MKRRPDIGGQVVAGVLSRPVITVQIVLFSLSIVNTRQIKQGGFSIYIFDNSKSKSMVRLVWTEKMVLCGLVFARKIARMILIQNMV